MKERKTKVDQLEDRYSWFDEKTYEKGKKIVPLVVDILQRNGGIWKQSWIDCIPRNNFDKILEESFKDTCEDLGLVERLQNDGFAEYMALDKEDAELGRMENRKRLIGIRKAFDEIQNCKEFPILGGWLSINHRRFSHALGELIEVREGKPFLRDDYEATMKEICTRSIPKKYRPLFDLLKDNTEAITNLVQEHNKLGLPYICWRGVLENGLSVESFYKWATN